ncbi:MAG: hypothetical protein ABSH32_07880 [Bryobacteraceae bacterium]
MGRPFFPPKNKTIESCEVLLGLSRFGNTATATGDVSCSTNDLFSGAKVTSQPQLEFVNATILVFLVTRVDLLDWVESQLHYVPKIFDPPSARHCTADGHVDAFQTTDMRFILIV